MNLRKAKKIVRDDLQWLRDEGMRLQRIGTVDHARAVVEHHSRRQRESAILWAICSVRENRKRRARLAHSDSVR